MLRLVLALGVVTGTAISLGACGSSSSSSGKGGEGGAPMPVLPSAGSSGDLGGAGGGSSLQGDGDCKKTGICDLIECDTGALTGDHVEACSVLSFETNPPTSGPHYPDWAQFGIYETEVPRGYWLHTIEHSAVALLYNCDEAAKVGLDCEELKAQLQVFYDAFPNDDLCSAVPHRLFIAPDSELDAPFAAVAWGYYLKGVCFDPASVTAFVQRHYGKNYENLCASGLAQPTCP